MNPGLPQHNLLCDRPLPLPWAQLSHLLNGDANSGTCKIQVGTFCCSEPRSPPRSLEHIRGPGRERRAGVDVTVLRAAGGWGLPPDTQKQLNKSGPGTPNPSRLWLLPLTQPGPPSPGQLPGLGGGQGTAKSAESGQQDQSDARPSRRPRFPRWGEGPAGRVTQASQTPSRVGTFPRLSLFLEQAPGLSVEGQGRGCWRGSGA